MTRERHLETATERGAVDRRDNRFGAALDEVEHAVQTRVGRRLAELRDVRARDERASRARDDNGLGGRVRNGLLETVVQTLSHVLTERVDGRVVDGQHGHAAATVEVDGLSDGCHGRLHRALLVAEGLYSYAMTTSTVERPSVCPLDCPDTCSLTVTVEAGRITKIRGSRANPYTAGVLCAKVPESYPEFVHGPGRLVTPLRRAGAKGEGRFERISWDEALDLIHARFTSVIAQHGAQAIMPLNYAGPHGTLAGGSMDLRFFHRLGATLLDRPPLCGGIRSEAWAGTYGAAAPGIPPEQMEHSKLIVAWGYNVTWSGLHMTPVMDRARGAFPKTPAKLTRPDLVPKGTRTVNIVDVGRHLTDLSLAPPLKAIFVYNHNPLVVHPDQNRMRRGLAREDLFVVGCDVVMTDSLAYADVVLPACSHFEHDDLFAAYGTHWLQRAEPVIRPQGQALPNTEIFRRLAARFGFDGPEFTASDAQLMDDAIDGSDPRLGGVQPSRIPVDAALLMKFDGAEANLFTNVFPKTKSGKVELASPYLEEKFGARLPSYRPFTSSYPLILITPASDRRTTSTFGGCTANAETPPLEIHPDDAKKRGLSNGMRVRVWNDLGEVRLPVRVTDAVPPGVVCSLKGAWMKTSDNGQTVSALAPAHHADICGGACYNDTRVEVAPA